MSTLRESWLRPPFTRAWLNPFAFTFRALGRSHLGDTTTKIHRDAMFQLNSWIPLRGISSRQAAQEGGPPLSLWSVHNRGRSPNRTPRGGQPSSLWSHRIFPRYTTSLPTSLSCIASIDQRLIAVETCCGAAVRSPCVGGSQSSGGVQWKPRGPPSSRVYSNNRKNKVISFHPPLAEVMTHDRLSLTDHQPRNHVPTEGDKSTMLLKVRKK